MRYMRELDLAGRRVMIREDLNVPLSDGRVASDARIRAALPTIRMALERGAAVIVLSHLGRPAEGQPEPRYSLAPVAARLGELLEQRVRLEHDWLDGVKVEPGQVVLCENVRFNAGEKVNDPELARRMAALCDVFVMDAFGAAHRAQASTEGVVRAAPLACAGPLLAAELQALDAALSEPKRPLVAIMGGSKVSTKLGVLRALVDRVDHLIVGGGIANAMLAAAGHHMGASKYEQDQLAAARALNQSGRIPLPVDVRVAASFSDSAEARVCGIDDVPHEHMVLDIGPETEQQYAAIIGGAGTVLWNGPVGVFEFKAFEHGTRAIAEAVAASSAYSVVGGGDTVAALDQFGLGERMSYISTGGGAFLEYVEGRELPAIAALNAT